MKKIILSLLACSLLLASASFAAEADVQERIRSLEQQLEALRQQKASQEKGVSRKEAECYQVFPSRGFCACLASRLPANVSFTEYVTGVAGGSERSRGFAAARDACGGQASP